jgi:hypothetical protein
MKVRQTTGGSFVWLQNSGLEKYVKGEGRFIAYECVGENGFHGLLLAESSTSRSFVLVTCHSAWNF